VRFEPAGEMVRGTNGFVDVFVFDATAYTIHDMQRTGTAPRAGVCHDTGTPCMVNGDIFATYGSDYLPEKANRFKQKSSVQDAHEAIRPTSLRYDPETVRPHLTPDQYYLYRLIWNRFVASQMPPATFDETTVDITAGAIATPEPRPRD
jgi:hypothetical protein